MVLMFRVALRTNASFRQLSTSVQAFNRLESHSQVTLKLNRNSIVVLPSRFAHGLPPNDPKYGGDANHYPGYPRRPEGPKTVEDFINPLGPNKNWASLGFDHFNQENDRFMAHFHFFCLVTVCCVTLVFLFMFYPDSYHLQNWAIREAYLELERREKLGLPLVDKNYVDPAKISLPSEEELKDVEVYY